MGTPSWLSGYAAAQQDVAAKTHGGKGDQKQRPVHNVYIEHLFPTVWKFSICIPCSGAR